VCVSVVLRVYLRVCVVCVCRTPQPRPARRVKTHGVNRRCVMRNLVAPYSRVWMCCVRVYMRVCDCVRVGGLCVCLRILSQFDAVPYVCVCRIVSL